MTFPERAVLTCAAQMKEGRVSERSVRDILRCVRADISPIIQFLSHADTSVRMAAVRLIGEKGDIELLFDVVRKEQDKSILLEAMRCLGKRGKNMEQLVGLLETSDSMMKQEAIAMFRKSGNLDCLFALLFDSNLSVVEQVKEYFNERQGKHLQSPDSKEQR